MEPSSATGGKSSNSASFYSCPFCAFRARTDCRLYSHIVRRHDSLDKHKKAAEEKTATNPEEAPIEQRQKRNNGNRSKEEKDHVHVIETDRLADVAEQPRNCFVCHRIFAGKANLSAHLSRDHGMRSGVGGKKYRCPRRHCTYATNWAHRMEAHRVSQHGQMPELEIVTEKKSVGRMRPKAIR